MIDRSEAMITHFVQTLQPLFEKLLFCSNQMDQTLENKSANSAIPTDFRKWYDELRKNVMRSNELFIKLFIIPQQSAKLPSIVGKEGEILDHFRSFRHSMQNYIGMIVGISDLWLSEFNSPDTLSIHGNSAWDATFVTLIPLLEEMMHIVGDIGVSLKELCQLP